MRTERGGREAGQMSFSDHSAANLLAACGGDTVKLFDVTVESGDPCALSYTPTPGSLLNCVKWNHTNQVVASAGDDKKISLFRNNGKIICTLSLPRNDMGDPIDESISTISFSNRGSRYLCSGGSEKTVRIWDLQRKLCIKKLTGHRDTITGVMYNCKDEYLASISLKGDLILHNLTSGARSAELKDPNGQVLRVLDYSRLSRHILVTAGDDGSVHLWDTTGRNPKASWLKQHSAPTTGVCFSPSSDKIIATVGLDKKLYTYDSASKKPTFCAPYEAPFASLVFRDDGNIMAAGTNTGHVVFYDVRGKPQPFTVLRAYNSSEAVTSLCWQRSKPVIVNADNCSDDIALLGGAGGDDSILMPDPLPSVFSSTTTTLSRSSPTVTTSGLLSVAQSSSEETPLRASLWGGGALSRLHAPRGSYNFKDDMDIFSPLVDVQPITPSLGNMWDEQYDAKREKMPNDNKSILSSTIRKFPHLEANFDHPILDCESNATFTQDGVSQLNGTTLAASKGESSSSTTPPEAWGGTSYTDKLDSHCEAVPSLSRILHTRSVSSGSTFAGLQDVSGPTKYIMKNSLTSHSLSLTNIQSRVASSHEIPSGVSELSATTLVAKTAGLTNFELPATTSPMATRRFSTYAERIGIASSFSDGMNSALSSPKPKKLGTESREELTGVLCRQDSSGAMGNGSMPSMNGLVSEPRVTDSQQAVSSFSLQLIQRTLEGTLGSVQDAIHEDVRNLHIELLRQFHMQEMEMSGLLNTAIEKIDDLRKEVHSLKSDNKQLRQLLGLQ